jgi:hypothetical protein
MSEESIIEGIIKLLKKKSDHDIIIKYIDMRLKILSEPKTKHKKNKTWKGIQ